MTIYKITNIENKKIYIGKTITTSAERWQQHLYEAFNEKNSAYNYSFHKAIRKYGADKFIVEDIDSADNEAELNKKEKFWIKFYRDNFGRAKVYNIADGGNGGRTRGTGWQHTEEAKLKMSKNHNYDSNKNRPRQSEETKQKISMANSGTNNGMFGQHHTEETKLKISKKLHTIKLGTTHSEETKNKMSESHKGIFKNRLSINKDGIIKYIQATELDYYLSNGWKRGTGRFKNK